jgi:hypothetical protein
VLEVKVPVVQVTRPDGSVVQRHRGFGFVTYASQQDAQRVVERSELLKIRDREVAVDFCMGKQEYQKGQSQPSTVAGSVKRTETPSDPSPALSDHDDADDDDDDDEEEEEGAESDEEDEDNLSARKGETDLEDDGDSSAAEEEMPDSGDASGESRTFVAVRLADLLKWCGSTQARTPKRRASLRQSPKMRGSQAPASPQTCRRERPCSSGICPSMQQRRRAKKLLRASVRWPMWLS